VIPHPNVVWVGDPERGWGCVSVQDTMRSLGLYNQIFVDIVLCFNTILDEDIVSLAMIINVFSNM
jgi:hypothetical protein